MLAEHLDESQMRDLCASMGVDYGSLPGAGKDDKARELVLRLAHRGRSAELVAACMGLRPDVAWEQALAATEDESPVQAAPQKVAQVKLSPRVKLTRMMTSHFDEAQLRDLCSELGADYDNLAGQGKSGKVRELVISFERRGRTPDLVEACARRRPDLDW
jgi:fructoselysine-6-P-deglycase FrlB-like protein